MTIFDASSVSSSSSTSAQDSDSGLATVPVPKVYNNSPPHLDYARYLVDVSLSVMKTIQEELISMNLSTHRLGDLELMGFISSVFRFSKVSYSTLLTALLYLLRFRHAIQSSRTCNLFKLSNSHHLIPVIFVASVVVATKFLLDRHVSNKVWSENTGLSLFDINRGEMAFLFLLDHSLAIDSDSFQKWTSLLFQPHHLQQYQTVPTPNFTMFDATHGRIFSKPKVASVPSLIKASRRVEHPMLRPSSQLIFRNVASRKASGPSYC